MREPTAARPRPRDIALLCVVAWAVPGAAHLWLRQSFKGIVFLVVLPLMFVIGIALQGRLFPFEPASPLVALAFLAELSIGVPFLIAEALKLGAGQVTAAAFEYANAFLIVSGLLNLLVMLDAYDVALGRKSRNPPGEPR
jgi:phosphoglycerol transferase MdoB-like AlkP superfamily enzyme